MTPKVLLVNDNAASLTDGIYTSSAQGCLSDVTVTVTV